MRLIDADALIKEGYVLEKRGVSNSSLGTMSIADVPTADRWIPCSEGLPEVSINPITNDYVKYNVTIKSRLDGKTVYDTRQYGFGEASGGKHWLYGGQIMDAYVIAWQPLPEPYKEGLSD